MYNNKINKYRKQKNMTLKEVADECGISTGYLCHLEKGNRKNPSTKVMQKISDALGESIAEIFFSN